MGPLPFAQLLASARKDLATALTAAQRADAAFEAALQAAGYQSRWSWGTAPIADHRPVAAYNAKLAADAHAHACWERVRRWDK